MIHRRLLELAGIVPGAIGALGAIGVLISALHVAFALAMATAIGAVIHGDGDPHGALLLLGAIALVRAVLLWLREPLAARIGASVRISLRRRLLAQLPAIGAEERRAGDTTATIIDGVDGLDAYYTRYLPQLIVVLLVPTAIVVLVAVQDTAAGVVLAVAAAVTIIVPRFWDALLLRNGRKRWSAFARLSGDYAEALQSIPLLRGFGAASRVGAHLDARADDLRRRTMRQMRVSLIESGISALAMHAGTVLAVVAAAAAAMDSANQGTAAVAVLLLARECFRPLAELSTHWHAGYLGLTAVDGLDRLLSRRPGVIEDGVRDEPSARPAVIELRRVGFRHPGSARGVHYVSLRIRGGETIAVLGPSGSGKSTLARLLERDADPETGEILLDGVPLRHLTRRARTRSVVVVAQDPVLFTWTVRDNLRLYRPDAGDDEVIAAARAAVIDDVIRTLPDGYDTVLAENGAPLSGGQRQRLAIARALLARTPVLVLDEVTSALDIDTERRVMDGASAFDSRRTTILIAHRESACIHADRWIRMTDGRIVAGGDGPPQERARRTPAPQTLRFESPTGAHR